MILIETSFLEFKGTGIYTVINDLLKVFSEQNISYRTISYFDFYNDKKNFTWIYYFNFILQKEIKKLEKNDVFLCPENLGGFFLYTKKRCKSLFIIHDLFEFQTNNKLKNFINSFRLKNILNNVDTIITVSEVSKTNIINYFPSIKSKVRVLYPFYININGYENNMQQSIVDLFDRWDSSFDKFILVNGSGQKRKNAEFIIRNANEIFKDFGLKIVMFGKDFYNDGYHDLNTLIDEYGCKQNILHLGAVSNEQLKCLYKNAECFVFPSYDEGFGLPPVEALHSGGKVLCSNIPIFREVLSPCNDFFDFSYDSLKFYLQRIIVIDSKIYDMNRCKILEKFSYEEYIRKLKEMI